MCNLFSMRCQVQKFISLWNALEGWMNLWGESCKHNHTVVMQSTRTISTHFQSHTLPSNMIAHIWNAISAYLPMDWLPKEMQSTTVIRNNVVRLNVCKVGTIGVRILQITFDTISNLVHMWASMLWQLLGWRACPRITVLCLNPTVAIQLEGNCYMWISFSGIYVWNVCS